MNIQIDDRGWYAVLLLMAITLLLTGVLIGMLVMPDAVEVILWRYLIPKETNFASLGYHGMIGAC